MIILSLLRDYLEYLIPLVMCFLVSFVAINAIKPFAIKFGLVDKPNERKKHVGNIPLIGGVAIFIGVVISASVFLNEKIAIDIYFLISSLILLVGVLDDKFELSIYLKIIVQIIIALMMVFQADYYLTSFGKIFGSFELTLGYFGVFFTVIAVIGAINAFNMVDGIDGLAGMLSIISFSFLALLLFRAGSNWYLLALLFDSAILAYLIFNLSLIKSLNKIFMGDAGSMLIGLTIIWLLVVGVSPEVNAFKPVTALYIIAIPLMDLTAVIYRRLKRGVSPFHPDRNHLHHIFQEIGFSEQKTLFAITMLSFIFATFGVMADIYQFPEWIMFGLYLLMYALYFISILNLLKSSEMSKNQYHSW